MNRIAEEMLRDINKDTVDFGPNYDGSQDGAAGPARALSRSSLANGSSGIAVGMATNIPPQNLSEICAAIVKLIDTPDASHEELMKIVRGPDFPPGASSWAARESGMPITTGRGKIIVRAKVTVESSSAGKDSIIVTEIPYQVNKSALIVRIADLVKEKKIDGIVDLNDESDRHGMRIVIDLRKGVSPKVILNQLFAHTQLQTAFGVINLALVKGLPQTLSAEGDARALHRPSQGGGHPEDPLRPGQGGGARPHPPGPEDRAGQHRRGDRDHQEVREHGQRARRAS